MKKTILALLPLCIGAFILTAADTKAPPDTKTPVADLDRLKSSTDRFMAGVTRGLTTDAFLTLLRAHWFKVGEAGAETANLDSQYQTALSAAAADLGRQSTNSFEFLGRRRLGNTLVTYVYVQKFDFAIWPWTFAFYKAQDTWKLRNVTFGENAWDDMMALTVSEPAR
jgi:hypothetical protein